jgi:hypothetical protein
MFSISQCPLDSAVAELRFLRLFVLGEQASLGVWFVVKSRGKALNPVVGCALLRRAWQGGRAKNKKVLVTLCLDVLKQQSQVPPTRSQLTRGPSTSGFHWFVWLNEERKAISSLGFQPPIFHQQQPLLGSFSGALHTAPGTTHTAPPRNNPPGGVRGAHMPVVTTIFTSPF